MHLYLHLYIRQIPEYMSVKLIFHLPVVLLLLLLTGVLGCASDQLEHEIISINDEEAEQDAREIEESLSLTLANGLEVSLWASEKLLGDPIALQIDNTGKAIVSITNRSEISEFDIRRHREWTLQSLSWESVEDRRDFLHQELSSENSSTNTWLPDLNEDGLHDWRDLKVQKEEIIQIEDRTGNGLANQSALYIRDFHDEITDAAGAVLQYEDDIFVGVGPDMWRIKDTNNDGTGDSKESISHGYNIHVGYSGHGMSGLTVGPDGRIYWGVGDIGFSVVDQEGKKWHYPNQGAILRSEPDGSDFEVYAAGIRNTHEFSFDKFGNLIGVDNDGIGSGEAERIVHLVNGSDSGWRNTWDYGKYSDPKNNEYNPWMDENYYKPRNDDQSAHILPPVAPYHPGPVGMSYNPGTALSEEWEDHFFVGSFLGTPSNSGIDAFTLKPNGATFTLDTDQRVLHGLLPTGMDFGPDGALYFADYIEGWSVKDRGRIYKLDTPAHAEQSLRVETKRLLGEDFNGYTTAKLIEHLRHKDMRVRQKAQFELVKREAIDDLHAVAAESDHLLSRVHSIWGIAQMGRKNPDVTEHLLALLEDEESEIRSQAAKMLGDVRYDGAAEPLIPLLQDDHPRVRFFAVEALGRIAYPPATQPIVDMLERNNDEDVYLRHSGAVALSRIGDSEFLASLSDHSSRAVRIAAVVALKRMGDAGVARYLNDDDEYIVINAARAINDDTFITDALPELAKLLEQVPFVNEPLIRRSINANLYLGTDDAAVRLAYFAQRQDYPEALRLEALHTLSVWTESSVLDRVSGKPRGSVMNDPEPAQYAMGLVLDDIFEAQNNAVSVAAIRAIRSLEYQSALPEVFALLERTSSSQIRIAALETLYSLGYEDMEQAITLAMGDSNEEVRMNALTMIDERDMPESTLIELLTTAISNGTAPEQQSALATLGSLQSEAAHNEITGLLNTLIAGDLDAEIHLELLEIAESSENENITNLLEQYKAALDDPLGDYKAALYGGNAERGRRIFFQDSGAMCVRCHVVDGQGSEVGPDLSAIGDLLSRELLLESLVEPGARATPGFRMVTLTLNDGDIARGLLQNEDHTQITLSNDGANKVIQKSNIAGRVNSPSAMPDMKSILSRRELRDVVEYLSTLKDG